MKTTVRVNSISAAVLAAKRKIQANGQGQKFFTHEVRRLSDPYVPFRSGTLKNSAQEKGKEIHYITPYARRQWYENKGSGMRGKMWCKRAFAARRSDILKSVANFVGGKPK
ncbi:minor capsid protein [Eubacteriaceae bacterium ES2]|nr:minor capsid protein [Eubacteriaceae bacterium ES2]